MRPYVADEIRITQNQGLLLKFVQESALPSLYKALSDIGFANAGFDSLADITTCPGTDTCNLGISNSMTLAEVLEEVIYEDFPDFIYEKNIKIKISGCMNSCGQHGLAEIGFHGSSLKSARKVLPALQVLLGGGTTGNGGGRIADKVIKVPSKRGPQLLRVVLNDYETNGLEGEYFNDYYDRQGEKYFYSLLKPVADLTTLKDDDFIDWGASEQFATEIGVGECAGVMIDLVATLLFESEEKLEWTLNAFNENRVADSIYHAYSVFVSAAKALLLDKSVNVSTQSAVIEKFDEHFVAKGEITIAQSSFKELVLQINQNEPSIEFATTYIAEAKAFLALAKAYREQTVEA